MRILLDESIPSRLWRHISGHQVNSVQRCGRAGIKNGKLLALAATEFDATLTVDQGIEHQQNPNTLPISVVIIVARSNRLEDLLPYLPAAMVALTTMSPHSLVKVGA